MFRFNTNIVFILMVFFAAALVFQMGRWQISEGPRFAEIGQAQYVSAQAQDSTRGSIYASDGTVLATDQPAWNVYASLSSLEDEREDFFKHRDEYIDVVSSYLKLNPDDLEEAIHDDFYHYPLAKEIDPELKKALEQELIFPERGPGFGLYFEATERRIYPNGPLASHILGYISNGVGQYGIEGYYYGDIKGTEGYTYEERDAAGNVILTSNYDPILPREGKDIVLTIDTGVQQKVEEILRKGVEDQRATSGTAILMNPKTGEIISMANYPSYDGNEFWRNQELWIYKNKAVSDVYEPGSIFKPITVAIGLDTGAITEDTVCNDATGSVTFYKGTPDEATIYTFDKLPDGKITPEEYLQYSNNPCIVETAMKIGHEQYYPAIKDFGIGEFMGVGLQDETNSYLMPYEYWTELDLAVTSFGQSVSVTPLQITSAMATIANDGKRMQPYIVKEVREDGQEPIQFQPRVVSQPISEEAADTTSQMLRSVVTRGDARKSFEDLNLKYDIGGKTGSAQIPYPDRVGYYKDRFNASFIGIAPVEDPSLVMLVKLENPKKGIYASTTAVPIWAEIFESVADDLDIAQK